MTTSQPAQAARESVRDHYTLAAQEPVDAARSKQAARSLGYGDAELGAIPETANLGLGCGNPTAIDTLAAGEVVLDLGCGAGMDVFVAAQKVGPTGHVIGVDMTEAMLDRARAGAARGGYTNVEFRHGLIEELPVADASVDAIISNCVVNLSPEKERAYREAYRVLKPGGRIMVSDIVVDAPLPPDLLPAADAYLGCVSTASVLSDYLDIIRGAGFRGARIVSSQSMAAVVSPDDPTLAEALARFGIGRERALWALDTIRSVSVFARK